MNSKLVASIAIKSSKKRHLSSMFKSLLPSSNPKKACQIWINLLFLQNDHYLTLRSISSLNNLQNREMKFCENMKLWCWFFFIFWRKILFIFSMWKLTLGYNIRKHDFFDQNFYLKKDPIYIPIKKYYCHFGQVNF
jgi:hypothetical protein